MNSSKTQDRPISCAGARAGHGDGVTLDFVTTLAALTAGFLWLWVGLLNAAAPVGGQICSASPATFATAPHCLLCYPAAAATLTAVIGAVMMLQRRARLASRSGAY